MDYYPLHVPSTFSDGDLTVREIVKKAKKKGYRVGISDHLSPYHSLRGDTAVLTYIDAVRECGAYVGCELDLGEEVPCSVAVLRQLDYIIGGLHSINDFYGQNIFFWDELKSIPHKREFVRAMVKTLVQQMEELPLDIIAHPTFIPPFLGLRYDEVWTPGRCRKLIKTAIKHDIAIEITNRWKDPQPQFLVEALSAGCTFSMASDGHRPEQVARLDYPIRMAKKLSIPEERFFIPGAKPKRLDREMGRKRTKD